VAGGHASVDFRLLGWLKVRRAEERPLGARRLLAHLRPPARARRRSWRQDERRDEHRGRGHGSASAVSSNLAIEVSDNGVGGAARGAGARLRDIADRLEALDGRLLVRSPRRRHTRCGRPPVRVVIGEDQAPRSPLAKGCPDLLADLRFHQLLHDPGEDSRRSPARDLRAGNQRPARTSSSSSRPSR
jgi:hypothetical protein